MAHVKEAQRTLGSKFTWICDAIDNPIKHAMGNAPNSEFVIDREGNVVGRFGPRTKPDDPAVLQQQQEIERDPASLGIHGPTVYVDPSSGMVFTKDSSHPMATEEALDDMFSEA